MLFYNFIIWLFLFASIGLSWCDKAMLTCVKGMFTLVYSKAKYHSGRKSYLSRKSPFIKIIFSSTSSHFKPMVGVSRGCVVHTDEKLNYETLSHRMLLAGQITCQQQRVQRWWPRINEAGRAASSKETCTPEEPVMAQNRRSLQCAEFKLGKRWFNSVPASKMPEQSWITVCPSLGLE